MLSHGGQICFQIAKIMAEKRPNPVPSTSMDNSQPKKKSWKARKQVYLPEYTERYPVIKASGMGSHYAFCTICKADFSIAASGVYDIGVHMNGKKHMDRFANVKTPLPSITKFFAKSSDMCDLEHQALSAEMMFTEFLIEHNVALAAADHFTKLLPKMCPDSNIAKKYSCGKTKTTALVHSMSKDRAESIVDCIKDKPFALSSDGSNNQSDKFYPIVISYVNASGDVKTGLLGVPTVEESSCTGLNIYRVIKNKLSEHGLNLAKCLAFGADNANVMSGQKNGVFGLIKHDHPHVYFAGCPCHLIHLGAKYACEQISTEVASRLIDIFWYLKHSAKRQNELSALKAKHGLGDLKVLKYCPTRWLSLRQCVSRLLTLWGPLRDFFQAEEPSKDKNTDAAPESSQSERLERCTQFLKSHTARVVCLFLEFVLEIFDRHNQALQFEKPEIHKSKRIMHDLYKELLLKFLKPSAFSSGSIVDINPVVPYHQKADNDLVIGSKCRQFMADKKFSDKKVKGLLQQFRAFYHKATTYLQKKLPMEEPLLRHTEFLDLSLLPSMSFSSVKFFTDKYPFLLENSTLDNLESEFLNLQVEKLPEDLLKEKDAGKQWTSVAEIKDHTGNVKYSHLGRIAKFLLCIPHSNAGCERVFSHVKHIRTNARPSMKKDTLSALCIMKESNVPCYAKIFSKTQTKQAKSATTSFLDQQ